VLIETQIKTTENFSLYNCLTRSAQVLTLYSCLVLAAGRHSVTGAPQLPTGRSTGHSSGHSQSLGVSTELRRAEDYVALRPAICCQSETGR